MKIRAFLAAKWPELMSVAGLALIAFFVWQRFFGQQYPAVHLSCFAYRDVNRNGVYDVGDRPYAGLKVTVERPKKGMVEKESNVAGFANFDMSQGNRQADIYLPGDYKVRIAAPEGWDVTSTNALQTFSIEKQERTAVGLVAAKTIDSVGVAPRLNISGTIAGPLNSGKAVLKAKGPSGKESVIPVSKEGAYVLAATAGTWSLEYQTTDAISVIRNVTVEKYPVVVARLTANTASFAAKPKTKVIGFDNLTTSDTLLEIPNGYEGLDWRNWVATHQKLYEGSGFINVATSSEYVAYTSSGHPATISSPTLFDFVGAYVGVAWPKGEQHDIVVKAWRNETQIHEDRFRGTVAGPVYFDADYRSITRVEFSSAGYWQVVMDDVVCRTD